MKKIITIILFSFIFAGLSYPAVKVNISLGNYRLVGGIVTVDVIAQVLTGQTWRVGSSNLRIDWVSIPAGAVTVRAENPCYNPNLNLSNPNNANYSAMQTTSISGGATESLNITRLGNCYLFSPGTYVLGSVRFNRVDTTACIRFSIRTTSVMQDSITQLLNPADWTTSIDTVCRRLDGFFGVGNNLSDIPRIFKLYNNYPNPFNPVTVIKYDVPKAGNVTISIYDILGKEVEKLVNGYISPGRYSIEWNASNYASGTYFYRFESDNFTDVKKMSLIK